MKDRNIKIFLNIIILLVIVSISITLSKNNIMAFTDNAAKHPIYSVDTKDNVVCITFDVNWAEKDNLSVILDLLDKYNVKGTFFIMGGWVNYSEDNVNKLKDIAERGHEIGNHSYMHPSFSKISEQKMEEEILKTDEIIKKYTGKDTVLFRFPSGDYNESSVKKVNSLNHYAIQWDDDSVDWKELGYDVEYNKIMKKVHPGAIMLFHNNAKYTPQNLERIIVKLKEQGYEFKTVGEVIYTEDYYVDENGIQHKK